MRVYAERSLAQGGIGIRGGWLHGWTPRKRERRIDIVLRLLSDRLNERKLRNREGRRESGLLKENHAVAGAYHPGIADPIRESHARAEVTTFQFAGRMGKLQNLRL